MNKTNKNLKKTNKLRNIVNLKKITPEVNYLNIILGLLIVTIIILQIRTPFIGNSINQLKQNVKSYFQKQTDIEQANNEIAEIEEESLIRVNNNLGGVDDVNANTNNTERLMRPQLMLQESIMGSKSLKETFENKEVLDDNTTLKLFYQPGCPHSEAFMTLWTQIKEVLPNNIETEEINCARKDILGFSLCSNYGVSQVPTLMLVKPDRLNPDDTINIKYHGSRDFMSIKQWLLSNNVRLTYNPEVEHFDKTGGYVDARLTTEKFNDIQSGLSSSGFGGAVLSADGNLRAPYDQMYRDATKMNDYGEFNDVDEDGCPIAYFSKCKENSVNPGYQIFTHRGQWGCVYPDKNTSLNTGFDAAFASVDHYLQSLPPKMEKVTNSDGSVSLKVTEYSAEEKLNNMKKCAIKYKDEIRNFGLCDNNKLNDKYVIKEKIEKGELKIPYSGMSANDYKGTMETAEALYNACSL